MAWKRTILDAARRSGALSAFGRLYGADRLAVLAYHRVTDHTQPGFAAFAGNVSASPAEFSDQMGWIAREFSVVSLTEVVAATSGAERLPDRAVLITFDDGYQDNLDNALPVLRRLGLPAVLFLATDHIATGEALWWDRAAAFFVRHAGGEVDLPILGHTAWGAADAQSVAARWIRRAKLLPHGELRNATEALAALAEPGVDGPTGLMMDWHGAREMAANGVAIGGHTCTHPILTRVNIEIAREEIVRSKSDVEREIGAPALGFAYPNGGLTDFDERVVAAVRDAGYPTAFTLVPGPARSREVVAEPLRIRRIYVHHGDGLSRFAAKVAGVPRLTGVMA
jgi:peptidoglycan/xylan/chitin deacetylase (PgdA/CDA1 family)